MKKLVIALVAVLALGVVSPALAEIEVTGDAYVTVNSSYIWRGIDFSNSEPGDATFVVQPGVDLSAGGFTVSWWANINENTGNMDEVDLVLDYSTDLNDLVSLSVGNILYDVDGAMDTNELYLGVSLATILEPNLTVYYDYDELSGDVFVTGSVGHSVDVAGMSLGLGALVSFIDSDAYSDLHNLELTAGVDYALNEQVTISPAVLFSTPISDDAEDVGGLDDEFVAGVTVALNF